MDNYERSKILAEQDLLIKIEKNLQNMLGKINENINTLKVEELQLKANAVLDMKPNLDVDIVKIQATTAEDEHCNIEKLNQQHLDLNMHNKSINYNSNEEYDTD